LTLLLTYHAVEDGPAPLYVAPDVFRTHLDVLEQTGARTLTVAELADALRARRVPERAVALTFDDGIASVVQVAVPLLVERGMTATLFCVAGHLGGASDWPSQPRNRREFAHATAPELRDCAGLGFEIGSHGLEHEPLGTADGGVLERELAESKASLERELGVEVRSFAYPYGAASSAADAALRRAGYTAACIGSFGLAGPRADPFALPRIDVHYLRRPALLRRAHTGSLDGYLAARRLGARAKRLVRRDYRTSP
jgi:peptidoglycan/xylan/chitin deacetylase (PgdA/CDA1 family)